MDTIFMNSENSRTSEYHVLVLKLTDKLDLRRGQKIRSKKRSKKCCFIKSYHLLYMEKHKKLIQ